MSMPMNKTCPNCGNRWEVVEWAEDRKSHKILKEKEIAYLINTGATCEGGCCGGTTLYQCRACMYVGEF